MNTFAELIRRFDGTNKTTTKVKALAEYFQQASDSDKIWTIAILSSRRPPRPVNTTLLRTWANELANIPLWLFEESYHIVGDLAETIALILPAPTSQSAKSLTEYVEDIIRLRAQSDEEKRRYLQQSWMSLQYYERFVFTKLITGSFRIGISQKLMTRALSIATGIEENQLAHQLMGTWDPQTTTFKELILSEGTQQYLSRPFPFFLAHPIEGAPTSLGDVSQWAIEHKWDGIRAQIIVREGEFYIWSRGEELVTNRFPELHALRELLPNGTVIDGEILPWINGKLGTFNNLQKRIGRKSLSTAILSEVPVILMAFDLLELEGQDIRRWPYSERRQPLESLILPLAPAAPVQLSQFSVLADWQRVAAERQRARELSSEGLMIKLLDSTYQVGRKKGDWWKWKVEPLTIDAVLTYAMRGHGRRANLFTDYTFALWDESTSPERELVTFAKAYSGLTNEEFRQVDSWIKKHTLERFGPVRSVKAELVFEIGFEGVSLSKRHKSGIATRFPRILRWRHDKRPDDANSLADLKAMIP